MIQKKDMTENSILIAANGGGRIRIMSEVNKNENATAPKVDTRKTEINKFSLLFNRLGIWIIVVGLMILGMIVSKGQFSARATSSRS